MRISDIIQLNELTRPAEMQDAKPILKKAGWRVAGEGWFAEVYVHPDRDYALKIFDYQDKGYIDFLNLVKNNPNPHFPRVVNKLIKVTPKYYAVRIEKLEPARKAPILSTYYDSRKGGPNPRNEHRVKAYAITMEFLKDKPELVKALDLIYDILLPRYADDLHGENIMQRRDGTLVLTDPVGFE